MKKNNLFYPSAEYLYKHTVPCAFVTTTLMCVVSLYLWKETQNPLIIYWLTLGFANLLARVIFVYFIEKRYQTVRNEYLSKTLVLFSSGYTSLIWCTCALLFITDNQSQSNIFLIITMLGLISTVLPALSTYLPAFYLFSFPIFSALIWRFYSFDMPAPALSIALCFMTFLIISYHCHRSISQSLKLATNSTKLVSHHIKKRKHAIKEKQEAIKSSLENTKLIASASHDLRQPIHAMGLCLEALEAQLDNPIERKVILDKLKSCHQNFSDMFNTVLDVSQLDLAHSNPIKTTFDLNKILLTLISEFNIEASKKGLHILYQAQTHYIHSDINLITRLIRNLISNAIKYTESGSIRIECQRKDGSLSVHISDTGIGIPQQYLQSIFNMNFQVKNSKHDLKAGAGIGLAIVHKISQLLDLDIQVDSKEGQGTCFSFKLPHAEKALSPLQNSSATQKPIKPKVLVIENDPTTLEILRSMLKNLNCQPLIAKSQQEAMDHIQNLDKKVDLILSDYRLDHDENGISTIKHVRNTISDNPPSIIITGDTCPNLAQKIRRNDMMVMYKPLSAGMLIQALKRTRPKSDSICLNSAY